jgi:hypothetical protein
VDGEQTLLELALALRRSADGCTANYTVNEVVGRWLFKRSGFSDVVHSADAVQSQLAVFSKAEVQRMLRALASVSEHL